MLVQFQIWLANRRTQKYIASGAILCLLIASILFLGAGYLEEVSSISVNLIGNMEAPMMVIGGLLLMATSFFAWVGFYYVVKPSEPLHWIPIRVAGKRSKIHEFYMADNTGMCASTYPGKPWTVLEASLEKLPELDTTAGDVVGERMAELSELYEQYENKEAMCRQLLGKVLTAQEEERTRLARELHDTIGQSLTAIIMTTAAIEKNLPPDFARGKEQLSNVRGVAKQALQDLRNLIFDLRPDILDDLGLALAVRNQAQNYLESAGIRVRFRMAINDQLPPEVEITVFRVVQEAITNILRHSQATGVLISLTKKENRLIVRVEDNGTGFDPSIVTNRQPQTWGLDGMKERINLLGGKFYIGARPGSGTLVLAEVPLDQK